MYAMTLIWKILCCSEIGSLLFLETAIVKNFSVSYAIKILYTCSQQMYMFLCSANIATEYLDNPITTRSKLKWVFPFCEKYDQIKGLVIKYRGRRGVYGPEKSNYWKFIYLFILFINTSNWITKKSPTLTLLQVLKWNAFYIKNYNLYIHFFFFNLEIRF
jgi:hypothetical protein